MWKTQPLEPQHAMELLRLHLASAHNQQVAGTAGGASKVQLSKIPRPTVSGGCSQEDFKFFKRKWTNM